MKVRIDSDDGTPLALIEFDRTSSNDEVCDYTVKLVVDHGNDEVGVYRRVVEDFPRKSLNAVALLKAALNKFDNKAFHLEDGVDLDGETKWQKRSLSSLIQSSLKTLPPGRSK